MRETNRRFGVEIELVGLTVDQASAALIGAGINAPAVRYGIHRIKETWKVVHDGSVGYDGAEVVSPILQGAEGLRQVAQVLKALKAAGGTVNRNCGLHVHVDVSGLTEPEIHNVLWRYASSEHILNHYHPHRRRQGASMCLSHLSRLKPFLGQGYTLQVVTRRTPRCVSVNPHAYTRYGTVEFRQHEGTLDHREALPWIKFCLAFTEASRLGGWDSKTDADPEISGDIRTIFQMCVSHGRFWGPLSLLRTTGIPRDQLEKAFKVINNFFPASLYGGEFGIQTSKDQAQSLIETDSLRVPRALPKASAWYTGIPEDVRCAFRARLKPAVRNPF